MRRIITSCQGGTARRGEPLFFGSVVLSPAVPVVLDVRDALSVWNYLAHLYSVYVVVRKGRSDAEVLVPAVTI